MIRIRLYASPVGPGDLWLPGGLLIGLLLVGAALSSRPPAAAQAGAEASFFPRGNGRHFYLTLAGYAPVDAPGACTAGYRMAALWEILDVTGLDYDYDHPGALTHSDSGFGPPANQPGWVRTGGSSSSVNTPGIANCASWSAASPRDYGSLVRLARAWESPSGDIFAWETAASPCSNSAPVWCVGDFYEIALPLVFNSN